MLNNDELSWIVFTVVDEPSSVNDYTECIDLGLAKLKLAAAKDGCIEIELHTTDRSLKIGSIKLTLEGVGILEKLRHQ